jgi:hypothetical protein
MKRHYCEGTTRRYDEKKKTHYYEDGMVRRNDEPKWLGVTFKSWLGVTMTDLRILVLFPALARLLNGMLRNTHTHDTHIIQITEHANPIEWDYKTQQLAQLKIAKLDIFNVW